MNKLPYFTVPGYDGKKIYLFTRRHWIKRFLPIIWSLLILLLLIFFSIMFARFLVISFIVPSVIISIAILVASQFIFNQWIRSYYEVLFLTESELVEVIQEGVLDRRIINIPLTQILNITGTMSGFPGQILRFGNLILELQKGIAEFNFLPSPIELARAVMEARNLNVGPDTKKMRETGIPEKSSNLLAEFTTKNIEEVEFETSSVVVNKKHPIATEIREEIVQVVSSPLSDMRNFNSDQTKAKSWLQIIREEMFGRPKK
jgi:hypothetical protein